MVDIPKQIGDAGFMASRFMVIFLLGRQSKLALPAEAEKKKEAKDAKTETGIFSLLGYNLFLPRLTRITFFRTVVSCLLFDAIKLCPILIYLYINSGPLQISAWSGNKIFGFKKSLMKHASSIVFILGFTTMAGWTNSRVGGQSLNLSEMQALVTKAQQAEDQFFIQHHLLHCLNEELRTTLHELKDRSKEVRNFINYLYHAEKFSPFLSVVTVGEVKDVLHLNMMLEFLAPRIKEKFKKTILLLAQLADLRTDLKTNKRRYQKLEKHYQSQFNVLQDLLSADGAGMPVHHFSSKEQMLEAVNHLMGKRLCQPVTGPASAFNPLGGADTSFNSKKGLTYSGITNRLIRAPFKGSIFLAGVLESRGVILLGNENTFFLIHGMDKLLTYKGTKVDAQQSMGVVFGDDKQTRTLQIMLWQCKTE